jgi:hypothetical protein
MESEDYYKRNNNSITPYQRFLLNNYKTLFRLSVVSFKQEEPTVHLRNVYELLSLVIRYCNSTVFTTSLLFDVTYSYIYKEQCFMHVYKIYM